MYCSNAELLLRQLILHVLMLTRANAMMSCHTVQLPAAEQSALPGLGNINWSEALLWLNTSLDAPCWGICEFYQQQQQTVMLKT